uniref:Alpha galactosidase A C-terminal domain-containing protein n=1 Tax=Ciona savignyi TaxID=51511 RepID=H2ZPK5_CIOSA
MLICGDYSLSTTQCEAQFAIWAMLAAPLFMSNDLNSLDPEVRAVLQNPHVIAVNQDPLGVQGKRYIKQDSIQVFSKPLNKGDYAVAVLSTRTDGTPHEITFTLAQLKVPSGLYSMMDLFPPHQHGKYSADDKLTVSVDPNGVRMFRATPYHLGSD